MGCKACLQPDLQQVVKRAIRALKHQDGVLVIADVNETQDTLAYGDSKSVGLQCEAKWRGGSTACYIRS